MKELLFSLLILVLIYVKILYHKSEEYSFIKTNKKEYLVLNYKDKTIAAQLLEEIFEDVLKLKSHLIQKYGPKVKNLKNRLTAQTDILEASPHSFDKTYTLNKGEKIFFCLRRPKDNKLHKKNTLIFVAIHEMAHILSDSVGHNQEFHENFKFILNEAIEIGIYNRQDYESNPEHYCGMEITSSPLD